MPYHPSADPAQVAHSLLGYLSRRALAPGERLWRRGDEAQDCYILEKGSVRVSWGLAFDLPTSILGGGAVV